jgi:alpha-galactosidase
LLASKQVSRPAQGTTLARICRFAGRTQGLPTTCQYAAFHSSAPPTHPLPPPPLIHSPLSPIPPLPQIADALVSTNLSSYGYRYVNIDDGWAVARDNTTNEIIADPNEFPSGFPAIAEYIHSKNLSFGIYTCRGPLTCLKRPGSYSFESIDAATYAKIQFDFVKSDSCYGERSADVDYAIMRDALNASGRPMVFSVCNPGFGSGEFGHMWRTGPDLYSQQWSMFVDRFQLATTPEHRANTGPGAFPDPDNLEVGYSPRSPAGQGATPLEQRTMFSMWSIIPAPLVLAADLTSPLDPYTLETLTNADVIAVNQDELAAPGTPVVGDAYTSTSVWAKPLANGDVAVMLLNIAAPGNSTFVGFSFADVGVVVPPGGAGNTTVTVKDLWTGEVDAVYGSGYGKEVVAHGAVMLRVSV